MKYTWLCSDATKTSGCWPCCLRDLLLTWREQTPKESHRAPISAGPAAWGLVFCCAGCYALICSCSTRSWSSSACRHAVYIVLVFSNEWNLNLLHESLVCFEPVSCNPAALDVSIVTSLLASACLWLLANCWEPVDHSCLEALTQTVLLSRWFMCGGGKDTCTANKSEMNTTWIFGNPRCVSHISGEDTHPIAVSSFLPHIYWLSMPQ